jgi:hypothetical protein
MKKKELAKKVTAHENRKKKDRLWFQKMQVERIERETVPGLNKKLAKRKAEYGF